MADSNEGHKLDITHKGRATGPYDGAAIHDGAGGYEIRANAGEHPGFGYDRDRYEFEYDKERCTDGWVQFRLVPKKKRRP